MEQSPTESMIPPDGEKTIPVIREHIVSSPDTCGGRPRVAGTRIQVKHIVVMHDRMKMTPEQIVSEYPHLTLSDVHASLAYYHDHREEINADLKRERDWYEGMRANAPSLLKERLGQRMTDGSIDSLPS